MNWFTTYDCTSDGTIVDKDRRRQLAAESQMFPLDEIDKVCQFAKIIDVVGAHRIGVAVDDM